MSESWVSAHEAARTILCAHPTCAEELEPGSPEGARCAYHEPPARRAEIRATIGAFHGHELADIRVYAHSEDGLVPTRKGIAVRVEDLPKLCEAVDALIEASGVEESRAA